jgi:BssS protein family
MENVPLFPVTGTEVGTIREHGLLILRLPFLSRSMQNIAAATLDRTYVLTPNQARLLVQQIASRLLILDTAPPTGAPPAGAH